MMCRVNSLRKSVVQVGESSHGARKGTRLGTPLPFQKRMARSMAFKA